LTKQIIQPQKGFQTNFCASPADIVIGGGAAGVGKSFVLLLSPLRYIKVPDFGAVTFRRTMPAVKNEGGLWDKSKQLYTNFIVNNLRPRPLSHKASWIFGNSNKVKFGHLQYDKDVLSWQGAEIPMLGYDELTHFLESQFWYMLTRNRSTCGVKPFTHATTNPQGQGWVKNLIQWWLYPDDYFDEKLSAYPIPERQGKIRYFTRFKQKLIWGDSSMEVIEQLPYEVAMDYDQDMIKSITFIAGTLDDNQILLKQDPSYKANLLAQDETLQEQLLKGRWINYDANKQKLYDYATLVDSFSNTFVNFGKKFISADIAFEGSDKFVIGIWSGLRLIEVRTFAKSMGDEVLRQIKLAAQEHQVPQSNICYDADGVGGFLKGFLKSAYNFRNGSKAIPVDGEKQDYENLRTQCYYLLRKYFNNYEMFFDIGDDKLKDMILEELNSIERREPNHRGQLRINRKDEITPVLGRSPDYADMVMMRMIFHLIKTKKGKRRSSSL